MSAMGRKRTFAASGQSEENDKHPCDEAAATMQRGSGLTEVVAEERVHPLDCLCTRRVDRQAD